MTTQTSQYPRLLLSKKEIYQLRVQNTDEPDIIEAQKLSKTDLAMFARLNKRIKAEANSTACMLTICTKSYAETKNFGKAFKVTQNQLAKIEKQLKIEGFSIISDYMSFGNNIATAPFQAIRLYLY